MVISTSGSTSPKVSRRIVGKGNAPPFTRLFRCAKNGAATVRLGHALSGSLTLDVYTHAELPENIEAARLAGDAIEKAVNSVSLTAVQEKGPAGGVQQALDDKQQIGCGGQI